jgi:CRP-like cAMP-binding protein
MGQRIKENWERYGSDDQIDKESFQNLEHLKKMFLSQKFITIFLRSLQMFEEWTLKSLEKLLYVAEMKTLSKNEKVFHQGDEANGFYIIFKGDVLITHKIHKSYKEKLYFDHHTLHPNQIESYSQLYKGFEESFMIGQKLDQYHLDFYRSAYHQLVNNSKKVHSVSREIEIKVVGSGNLLGVEDAVLNNSNKKINNYSYSAVCKSATVKMLYFPRKD